MHSFKEKKRKRKKKEIFMPKMDHLLKALQENVMAISGIAKTRSGLIENFR